MVPTQSNKFLIRTARGAPGRAGRRQTAIRKSGSQRSSLEEAGFESSVSRKSGSFLGLRRSAPSATSRDHEGQSGAFRPCSRAGAVSCWPDSGRSAASAGTSLHARGRVKTPYRAPEAIARVFPLTTVQTCIIHLIRNSLAFVSWKDRKLIMPDLKAIYRAETGCLVHG
jgi:hypothetical protein